MPASEKMPRLATYLNNSDLILEEVGKDPLYAGGAQTGHFARALLSLRPADENGALRYDKLTGALEHVLKSGAKSSTMTAATLFAIRKLTDKSLRQLAAALKPATESYGLGASQICKFLKGADVAKHPANFDIEETKRLYLLSQIPAAMLHSPEVALAEHRAQGVGKLVGVDAAIAPVVGNEDLVGVDGSGGGWVNAVAKHSEQRAPTVTIWPQP